MDKKVDGIAVVKKADGSMNGRIISAAERDELLSSFPDLFKKPDITGANFTIGKTKSETGIGFRQLPGEAIFGTILTCPDNDCEFLVYADKEPDEFMNVVNALGGFSTFTEELIHFGNSYAASYPGGSGMWEMTCLPPNK